MTTFTTPSDLEAAQARCDKATEGEWRSERQDEDDGHIYWAIHSDYGYTFIVNVQDEGGRDASNAEFIAHARTDLPAALTALRQAWERIAELESAQRTAGSYETASAGMYEQRIETAGRERDEARRMLSRLDAVVAELEEDDRAVTYWPDYAIDVVCMSLNRHRSRIGEKDAGNVRD